MKWIKIEQIPPATFKAQFPERAETKNVYIPETAVKEVVFFKDRVVVDTEPACYSHYFKTSDENGKSVSEECEHRFCQWLDSEPAGWKVFLFTSF